MRDCLLRPGHGWPQTECHTLDQALPPQVLIQLLGSGSVAEGEEMLNWTCDVKKQVESRQVQTSLEIVIAKRSHPTVREGEAGDA